MSSKGDMPTGHLKGRKHSQPHLQGLGVKISIITSLNTCCVCCHRQEGLTQGPSVITLSPGDQQKGIPAP